MKVLVKALSKQEIHEMKLAKEDRMWMEIVKELGGNVVILEEIKENKK